MHHLIVPGLNNSGPRHWQTFWEKSLPDTDRVVQRNWEHPLKEEWIETLDEKIRALSSDTVLIAHSLGVVTVVHWLATHGNPFVKGVFLVSPSDADRVEVIRDFAPMPLAKLPVPAVVVASENDPFVAFERSTFFANAWGAKLVDVGCLGHINAKTDLGEWPEGKKLLADFCASIGSGKR